LAELEIAHGKRPGSNANHTTQYLKNEIYS
jgi:hypothetical protein